MSHTEMDRETCEVGYGLEQTDLETCPKSVWSPERRERLVSPIGDRLRVTRAREIRKRLTQAERKRKSVTKKAHGERETRASTRTNPALSKGHPQDVAHPATVDPAESSSETELYSVASLSETVRFQPLRAGSVTQEREHVLNGKGSDSTAPDADIGWSQRRHACRRGSGAFATNGYRQFIVSSWRSLKRGLVSKAQPVAT